MSNYKRLWVPRISVSRPNKRPSLGPYMQIEIADQGMAINLGGGLLVFLILPHISWYLIKEWVWRQVELLSCCFIFPEQFLHSSLSNPSLIAWIPFVSPSNVLHVAFIFPFGRPLFPLYSSFFRNFPSLTVLHFPQYLLHNPLIFPLPSFLFILLPQFLFILPIQFLYVSL